MTDEDNAVCLGVVEEELDSITMVGAVEGVSADADACWLPQPVLSAYVSIRQLFEGFSADADACWLLQPILCWVVVWGLVSSMEV